jgi:uncharacterized protein
MPRCVFIVAKEPAAGLAKTRLAQGIGTERAVALYRCFLEDIVASVRQLDDCALAFSFWPPEAWPIFRALAPDALLFPQSGADFGSRLLSGFAHAAAQGFDRIVLVGSDNPGLPVDHIAQALAALEHHPAVLGPSSDGGYYMLGLRAPQPALFHPGIAWSSELVAVQTRAAAAAAGLSLAEAPPWYDIDTASDLPQLLVDLRGGRLGAAAPATLARLEAYARNGLAELLALAV